MTRRDWRDDALCAQVGGDLWDPLVVGEDNRKGRVRDALSVCYRCPVIEPCGQFAKDTGAHGVWGGRVYGVKRRPAA